jgi:aspartate-semialdehyde dehydrogenase
MTARVAIVGATGAVGREFLRILEEREFPLDDLRLLGSSRSLGVRLGFRGEAIPVEEMGLSSLRGMDIAFFSAGSSVSREHARSAADGGCVVIDNSSAFRMDEDVPLVVPEINPEAGKRHAGIIANPNCSTIIFVVAIHPIWKMSGIRQAVVCTYQAVSGAGAGGIRALQREMEGAQSDGEVFPHPIAHNVVPQVGDFSPDGEAEEEAKMERETRKILGDPAIRISSTCVRVPILRAHSEAVHLGLGRALSPEQIAIALRVAPGVRLVDDPAGSRYPSPLPATGGDDVLVGRLRRCRAFENGVALFLAGDQLRKGAALNAVQIAERCL